MVPVIWALDSADVNAGTASAARIAIIAITTSSSISVNAEESLFLIFIFGFSYCSCSEGLLVAAIDLNRPGGSGEPPLPFCSQRVWFFGFVLRVFVLRGFGFFLRLGSQGRARRSPAAAGRR